jgi:polyisoprenoid-binding protein YceI
MKTKWTVDSNQSDVLIKMRHSIIAYLAGSINKFNGHIDIEDNQIEDASIGIFFGWKIKMKTEQITGLNDLFDIKEFPIIVSSRPHSKKSIKHQFLKGNLHKNITKVGAWMLNH